MPLIGQQSSPASVTPRVSRMLPVLVISRGKVLFTENQTWLDRAHR
jgi:hypothetical protein